MLNDSEDTLREIASGSYPSWPFGRLSDKAMAELLGNLEAPRKSALWEELQADVGEALL